MTVKICIFFLVCSLSFGYDLSDKESRAMNYIFGPILSAKIQKDIVMADDIWDGAIADYTTTTGKIRINSRKLSLFRENLIVVHEAIHWWQHRILAYKDLGPAGQSYSVSMDWTGKKLGVEAEAEIARQLALWFVGSTTPVVTKVHDDMIAAKDSLEDRSKLWLYLERFMKMQRPSDWYLGLL